MNRVGFHGRNRFCLICLPPWLTIYLLRLDFKKISVKIAFVFFGKFIFQWGGGNVNNNKVFGVGLLLFKSKDSKKFFTVREKKAKEEILKEAGMISFPLETYKKEDRIFENTLIRLIREEIGISKDYISSLEIIDQRFNLFPKRPDIYTLYGVAFLKKDVIDLRPSDNDDVEFFGWMEAQELKEFPVRREVWPILEDYYNYRRI